MTTEQLTRFHLQSNNTRKCPKCGAMFGLLHMKTATVCRNGCGYKRPTGDDQ